MDDLDLGATLKGFSPGQKVFNRYTLVKILGRGGMGVVWLARDDKLEREVALKFLPEVMMGDRTALSDLKRETRRSLELTHSHIVRIYDFVEDGRTAAIAMEYIAGESLTNARADRPGHCFEPADIATWVAQLCEALDYAHTKAKVVHRDLKPANLMIDADGDLKVTDFGISTSIADSVSRVSKQAGASGTPVYMSPQQMMGEKPAATDDIYALGVTLYDLLTGKPPFHTGNIVLQVQSKVAPSLAQRRSELGVSSGVIPPEWEQTIAACLAKEASDRPQSAVEVAKRLGLEIGRTTLRPSATIPSEGGQKSEPNPSRATPEAEQVPASKPKAWGRLLSGPVTLWTGAGLFVISMFLKGYGGELGWECLAIAAAGTWEGLKDFFIAGKINGLTSIALYGSLTLANIGLVVQVVLKAAKFRSNRGSFWFAMLNLSNVLGWWFFCFVFGTVVAVGLGYYVWLTAFVLVACHIDASQVKSKARSWLDEMDVTLYGVLLILGAWALTGMFAAN